MSIEIQEKYHKQSKASKNYWNIYVVNEAPLYLPVAWVVLKPTQDLEGIEEWHYSETECSNFGTKKNAEKFVKMLEIEEPNLHFQIERVPKDF